MGTTTTNNKASIELPYDFPGARQIETMLAECGVESPGLELKAHREVCPTCTGTGSTWHGWGGSDACSFTADEWDDLGEDDQVNYLEGVYDLPCPSCKGRNVVEIVTVTSTPTMIGEIGAMVQAEADLQASERAERAFGC